ncbi:MAG: hypothetical protein ACOX5R_07225 [bacterium]
MKILTNPILTQFLGPTIIYPHNQSYRNRLSYEKKIFFDLIDRLPKFDYFSQNFSYSITNWLPFYWKGFKQSTRYTYVIEDVKDLDKVFGNISSKYRNKIRKAERCVNIYEDLDAETFFKLNELVFERQGMQISYKSVFFADA